jgi:hypothetical protein
MDEGQGRGTTAAHAGVAYLTDLKHHRADSEWKAVRKAKAKSALKTLARVAQFELRRSIGTSMALKYGR